MEEFEYKYRQLFREYYSSLVFYAARIVGEDEAPDIVQDVFMDIWNRRSNLYMGEQFKSFLYQSVYSKSLNFLKHNEVKDKYISQQQEIQEMRIEYYNPQNTDALSRIENMEIRREISNAINDLPDKCRMIFKLSYLHGMKNKEIAEALDLSLRTVEAQMYKALKRLRDSLSHLVFLIILFCLNL